jgi:hypothetical protein
MIPLYNVMHWLIQSAVVDLIEGVYMCQGKNQHMYTVGPGIGQQAR